MSDEKGTIVFGKEMSPADAAAYKQRIQAARAGGVNAFKGNQPVGGIEKPVMPVLSQLAATRPGPSPLTEAGGVQPRPAGSPVLRPETAEQLQAFQQASAQQKAEETAKVAAQEKAEDDLFNVFDFSGKSEQERILNNKLRRKAIEARCSPMSIEDLVTNDEVLQTVPIVPNKFEVVFRSLTPAESLFVKSYLADEKVTTEQYIMEKYGLCQLTCSLVSINGNALPDHRNEHGEVTREAFVRKLKLVTNKSAFVVADLGLNFFWFDLRVRRLLNPEALGNG